MERSSETKKRKVFVDQVKKKYADQPRMLAYIELLEAKYGDSFVGWSPASSPVAPQLYIPLPNQNPDIPSSDLSAFYTGYPTGQQNRRWSHFKAFSIPSMVNGTPISPSNPFRVSLKLMSVSPSTSTNGKQWMSMGVATTLAPWDQGGSIWNYGTTAWTNAQSTDPNEIVGNLSIFDQVTYTVNSPSPSTMNYCYTDATHHYPQTGNGIQNADGPIPLNSSTPQAYVGAIWSFECYYAGYSLYPGGGWVYRIIYTPPGASKITWSAPPAIALFPTTRNNAGSVNVNEGGVSGSWSMSVASVLTYSPSYLVVSVPPQPFGIDQQYNLYIDSIGVPFGQSPLTQVL